MTKMKNFTCMMSSFLTLTGFCACLYLFEDISSPLPSHCSFTTSQMLFLSGQQSQVSFSFLLIVEITQRGPKKCIGWIVMPPVMSVLFFSVCGVMAVRGLRGGFAICGHFKHIQLGGFVGSLGKVILRPFLPCTTTFLIIPTFF